MKNKHKKLALVLEGGGARGAYQAGVLKALFEEGYKFDGVAGTSVGALNGVMVAQNAFEDSLKIWDKIDFANVLDINNYYGENLVNKVFDQETVKYFYGYIKKMFGQGGLDTTKIKNIIKSNIDEKVLRSSGIDFGVMTFSLTEKQPLPIFLEDMPNGSVADYVMASASFPGFQKTIVEGQQFIDGGVYDNMPINMIIDRGYKDIVAIETKSFIPKRRVNSKGSQIHYIVPSEKPGRVMNFTPESTERAILIGYYDALRILKNYAGSSYYIDTTGKSPFGYGLCDFEDKLYIAIANIFGEIYVGLKQLNEVICNDLKIKSKNFAQSVLSIYERVAAAEGIDRLKIYHFDDFVKQIYEDLYKISAEDGVKMFKQIKIVMTINYFLSNN